MYYVYLLKSTTKNFYYTGYTENLKQRLLLHNNGMVKSTKLYLPYNVIYYEACLSQKDALVREKYLKSNRGKIYLRRRLKNWFSILNM